APRVRAFFHGWRRSVASRPGRRGGSLVSIRGGWPAFPFHNFWAGAKASSMGRLPFPRNERLPHLTYPRRADADDVRAAFGRWRDEIVTRDGARGGLRTRRPDTPDGQANSSVSEGIAYGMIISVMFDEQEMLDEFWRYARCYLNQSRRMDWY